MTIKQSIINKVKTMKDETILEVINHHGSEDWRNWGDNELRIFAEEAFSRGLIK